MVRRRKPLSVMGRAVKVPYEFLRATTHRRLGLLDTPYVSMNNPG
jgi:hypothetical protein